MQNPFASSSAFGGTPTNDARFNHANYTIKRKFLQAFGATFYLYDPSGALVLLGTQKAFKLKEDLRLYGDEAKTQELLRIAARSILDFSAAYDVYDSVTNQKIGAFKRQGMMSALVQDSWILMDNNDREIGTLKEDSAWLGLARRFIDWISLLFPQSYSFLIGGQDVATYKRSKNPFSSGISIEFSPAANGILDKRLALAMAMLLEAIEGKQG